MKKLFNYRPILFVAMALIAGGYVFVSFYKFPWMMIVVIVAALAAAALLVVNLIKTKNSKLFLRVVCLVLLPFFVGGLVVNLLVNNYEKARVPDGTYLIEARVASGGVSSDGEIRAYLEDATLYVVEDTVVQRKYEIKGEVYLKGTNVGEAFYVGDRIVFYGTIGNYAGVEEKPLTAGECVAGAYAFSDIIISQRGTGPRYAILKWSRIRLFENMDDENAGIAYAMLFGEKLLMDKSTKANFNITGLAHILAVSGLHVGFVILIIGFLLKKLIKNRMAYSIVLLSVLIFYAYICNWSPSVVRAVVMCGVLLLSGGLDCQYDGLNALAIAGIANFIVAPLNIFNIGFILSFASVFAIFGLSPQIAYVLRNRMPRGLAASLALTLSAWAGTTPIIMFYFKSISPYSVIINLLVVPLTGVIFISNAACLALSLIPGTAKFFLTISELFIKGLNVLVKGFAGLKWAEISLSASYPIMVLGVSAILIASDYVFIKRKWLYAAVLAFGFLCCTIIFSL